MSARRLSILLVLLLAGCPARTRVREAEETASSPSVHPLSDAGDRGAPARTLTDAEAGVQFVLPDGWTARRVIEGTEVQWRAFGPPGSELVLELRRWDGDEASLRLLVALDPSGWLGAGPYAPIAAAVGAPIVGTWRSADPVDGEPPVSFGWFFRTALGVGVGLVATVKPERLESGYLAARDIAISARSVER